MIEFIFRPSRTVAGKRVVSRLFSGRYALDKGGKLVTVGLNTPDREIARKRLREIVLEKQREEEGIIAPKAVRVAAATGLSALIDEYEADLKGRELDEKHVHDTVTRLRRITSENGWRIRATSGRTPLPSDGPGLPARPKRRRNTKFRRERS